MKAKTEYKWTNEKFVHVRHTMVLTSYCMHTNTSTLYAYKWPMKITRYVNIKSILSKKGPPCHDASKKKKKDQRKNHRGHFQAEFPAGLAHPFPYEGCILPSVHVLSKTGNHGVFKQWKMTIKRRRIKW